MQLLMVMVTVRCFLLSETAMARAGHMTAHAPQPVHRFSYSTIFLRGGLGAGAECPARYPSICFAVSDMKASFNSLVKCSLNMAAALQTRSARAG